MAKFVKVPTEEKVPEEEEEAAAVVEAAEVPLWQDPVAHQALAVLVIAALTTAFVAMLIRGLFMGERKTRTKPAAMTGKDYAGKGFGGKPSAQDTRNKLKRR